MAAPPLSIPDDQVDEVVRLLTRSLGDRLLGAFLHGSAVLGGLRPASDLDVLAVAPRTLTSTERLSLVSGLNGLSATVQFPRPVELTVVAQERVRPWRHPAEVDFVWGEWLREQVGREGVPQAHPSPDLAVVLGLAHDAGRPLIGASLAELLDPVPVADVVAGALAGVPGLLAELEDDTRNVVLTLARVWLTAETGEVRAKDAAADWALPRLPAQHRPVLAHARELYLHSGYAQETWPDVVRAGARPYADHVVAQLPA